MNAPHSDVAVAPVSTNLFVTIPETTLPGGLVVPAFRVGQFFTSKGADGKAVVTADGTPWTRINYHEAREACVTAGFALLTETQALAIAWNVSQQDANWTGGKVGEGSLFQGLRNNTVDGAQPGTYVPSDLDEQRWFVLSNGERICDVAGNIYGWIFDNIQGDENGIIARDFAVDSPSITTAPYASDTHGMGDYEVWDWSGRALVRGGCWYSVSFAGAFYLCGDWPDGRFDGVGFRCTSPMVSDPGSLVAA